MIAFLSLDFLIKHWRAVAIAAGLAAIPGLAAYERVKGYEQGSAAETRKIEKANEEEVRRAQAAAKDVDACFAAGGTWNRDLGLCDPAAR